MRTEATIPNETFLWTQRGLKKPTELDNDLVLGVDRSGETCWRLATFTGSSEGANYKRVVSDFAEISSTMETTVCIQSAERKVSKISDIRRSDKLKAASNPQYILEKWACPPDKRITDNLAFVLGMTYRIVSLNRQNVVILVPAQNESTALDALKSKLVSVINLTDDDFSVENGPELGFRPSPWSWIKISSIDFSNLLNSFYSSKGKVPLQVRLSLESLQEFALGLQEVFCRVVSDSLCYETFPWEVEARKILFNLFFLHSIECNAKPMPSCSPDKIVLEIHSSNKQKLKGKPNLDLRGKRSVSKIRCIEDCSGVCSRVYFDGGNWSPILDLVYIL